MSIQTNDSSSWKAYDESKLTHSAAHYMMTIMQLRKKQGYARVTDLADHLQVSRGAASRAAAVLKERGWIEEDPNRMLLLTESGLELTRRVERTYMVVECFLEEILGVEEAVAREDACKLEHLLSRQTSSALYRLIQILNEQKPLLADLKERLKSVDTHCQSKDGFCPVCGNIDTCIAEALAEKHGKR